MVETTLLTGSYADLRRQCFASYIPQNRASNAYYQDDDGCWQKVSRAHNLMLLMNGVETASMPIGPTPVMARQIGFIKMNSQ
jgi:hypothetical protein